MNFIKKVEEDHTSPKLNIAPEKWWLVGSWKITFPLVPTFFLGGEVLNFQGVSLSACCTNSWDLLSWSWVHATSWAFGEIPGSPHVFGLLDTHTDTTPTLRSLLGRGSHTPKALKECYNRCWWGKMTGTFWNHKGFLSRRTMMRALLTWSIIPVIPVGLFHGPKWLINGGYWPLTIWDDPSSSLSRIDGNCTWDFGESCGVMSQLTSFLGSRWKNQKNLPQSLSILQHLGKVHSTRRDSVEGYQNCTRNPTSGFRPYAPMCRTTYRVIQLPTHKISISRH